MQIISRRKLRDFWLKHPQAEKPLSVWYALSSKAQWHAPADVKAMFGATVNFVADNRIIFDIGGNKYRLVVHVAYPYRCVLVKFVGMHSEYDRINPEII